jgi:hypothetical protein
MSSSIKDKPNGLESTLKHILDEHFGEGEWVFVGNHGLVCGKYTGQFGQSKNPDFKHKRKRKVIEVYAPFFKQDNYGSVDRWKRLTRAIYRKYGYEVLFVAKRDLVNVKARRQRKVEKLLDRFMNR